MKRLFLLTALAPLMLIACGKDKDPQKPNITENELLLSQINRMEPVLPFCDGGFAFPRNNNVDGRANCDTGDSMLFTGILLSTKPWSAFETMKGAIGNSIAPNGQPHRSPSYLQANYQGDSFSRDQFIGFLHYLVTTKDQQLASLTMNYIKSNKNKLCPNASDDRCDLTIGIKALADDVYQYIGLNPVYNVSRDIDDNTVLMEAKYAEVGYPMHLVSQKIFLRTRMGLLNSMHSLAASHLYDRQPNNLWFKFLNNLTHSSNDDKYTEIMNQLIGCMQGWEKPGTTWMFERERQTVCEPDSVGSDMVWLGKLLLEK